MELLAHLRSVTVCTWSKVEGASHGKELFIITNAWSADFWKSAELSSLYPYVPQSVLSAQLQAWMGHGYGLKLSATLKRPVKWNSDMWTMEDMPK